MSLKTIVGYPVRRNNNLIAHTNRPGLLNPYGGGSCPRRDHAFLQKIFTDVTFEMDVTLHAVPKPELLDISDSGVDVICKKTELWRFAQQWSCYYGVGPNYGTATKNFQRVGPGISDPGTYGEATLRTRVPTSYQLGWTYSDCEEFPTIVEATWQESNYEHKIWPYFRVRPMIEEYPDWPFPNRYTIEAEGSLDAEGLSLNGCEGRVYLSFTGSWGPSKDPPQMPIVLDLSVDSATLDDDWCLSTSYTFRKFRLTLTEPEVL